MTNSSQPSQKPQLFINFRGKDLRKTLMSFLKEKLDEIGDINVYMDTCEINGSPLSVLFERIRESSFALVIFSNNYPESRWCLDELVEIKKQMDRGSLVPFPVFYDVKPDCVKAQRGCFLNTLLKTEEDVRQTVDRNSSKSILETEARIWGWRQALVSVCGRMGTPYKHTDDKDFARKIVEKVKEMIYRYSSPRNYLSMRERPPMNPQEEVTSLLQALNLNISDLKDLTTKPSGNIHDVVSMGTHDRLVFLDLISLENPILAERLSEPGQAGKIFLVFLGSLESCNEGFDLKRRVLPKKPQQLPGTQVIVSTQIIQDQSYPLSAQVNNCTDVVANGFQAAESNDYLSNCLGQDYKYAALICISAFCNIQNHLQMMFFPPSRRVFISYGEKQLGRNLVCSLKTKLESNGITVYVVDEMEGMIKESGVAIVIFSSLYPESKKCLEELVEIKKLMDAGEIDPFPVFYNVKFVESVKKIKGCFLNRLLKIADEVRKNVKRGDNQSILDTEAKIWGWRQAVLSITSRPGLIYEHRSDDVFLDDVVTEVEKLFDYRERNNPASNIPTDFVLEKALVHRLETEAVPTVVESLDDELFYSQTSFLQALNLETTDLKGFTMIPKGLASLRLKGHNDLVFLNYPPEKLVQFQRSDSFKFLEKEFDSSPSGVIRIA